MKKIINLLLVCVIVMSACKKNGNDYEQVEELPSIENRALKVLNPLAHFKFIENPKNPYDSIGIWHNRGLYAIKEYVANTNDTSRVGRAAFLDRFFWEKKGVKLQLEIYPEMETPIRNDFSKVLKTYVSSENGNKYMDRLIELVSGIRGASEKDNMEFCLKISNLEDLILKAKLPDDERNILLMTTTVMRHSSAFWMSEFREFNQGNIALKKGGFKSTLRKIAGIITGITADGTVVGYHYLRGSPLDVLIEETIFMSELCGYMTGWYPELPF